MQAQKETIENLVQDKIDSSKISNSESNSEIKQVQHTNLDSIEIPQT